MGARRRFRVRAGESPPSEEGRDAPKDRLAGTGCTSASAVLVPLQVDAAGRCVVTLIRRTEGGRRHGGEVSLPGGRHEPERDGSLLGTALREAAEEIGLAPDDVEVLGVLSDRRTMSSGFVVTPFVGRLPYPYVFRRCQREVARVFSLPLAVFAPDAPRARRDWTFGCRRWALPSVRAAGEEVWGLTLDILEELARDDPLTPNSA